MANQIEILINAKDNASKVFDRASTRMGKFSKQVESMRGPLLATTAALSGLGVIGIKAASNLVESQNKAQRVFKDSTKIVEKFAKDSASAYGLSQRAAFEYAGTLGLVLNAAEKSSKETAVMSVRLLELAGDIASFNNIPVDEALLKLRAGLVGEAEPLRTVGVMMSEAATQAKAMEMGLAGSTKELTVAHKMAARYALIMEQTAEQQGDAKATADTLAGQMRILKGNFENVSAELGTHLIPKAIAGMEALNGLLTTVEDMPKPIQELTVNLGGLVASVAGLGVVGPTIGKGLGIMKGAVTGLVGLIGGTATAAIGGAALVGGAAFGIFDQFRKGSDELDNMQKKAKGLGITSDKLKLPYQELAKLVLEAELDLMRVRKVTDNINDSMEEYNREWDKANIKAEKHVSFLDASVELAEEMKRATEVGEGPVTVATLTPPGDRMPGRAGYMQRQALAMMWMRGAMRQEAGGGTLTAESQAVKENILGNLPAPNFTQYSGQALVQDEAGQRIQIEVTNQMLLEGTATQIDTTAQTRDS